MKFEYILFIGMCVIIGLITYDVVRDVRGTDEQSEIHKNCQNGHHYVATCKTTFPMEKKVWLEDVCQECKYMDNITTVYDCPCGLNALYEIKHYNERGEIVKC